MVEAYLKVLEEGYYEVTFAFEGLSDENVWKRPAEGLLSVGELAGHIAYWEAVRLAGGGEKNPPDLVTGGDEDNPPDLEKCRVKSLLIDHRFAYYPTTIATRASEAHLAMTAEQVCSELLRAHQESVAYFKTLNPDIEAPLPGYSPNHTYGAFLRYAAFHVAYHTGQMYTARHLLGENPPDN